MFKGISGQFCESLKCASWKSIGHFSEVWGLISDAFHEVLWCFSGGPEGFIKDFVGFHWISELFHESFQELL